MIEQIRQAQIDLDSVRKISTAAYGLAVWLNALTEFSHASGLIKQAKFVPLAKRRD